MPKRKSKKDMVLIHLQMHGSITSWEAIEKFRATRLSDIVFKLKQDGHNISSAPEYNENTGTNYARYTLHRETESGQFSLI